MPGCIAVINAGSSSVKFAIYAPADAVALYRGQVEGIGTAPHLRIVDAKAKVVADQTWDSDQFDHATATREILLAGQRLMQGSVGAIGHRVVHGGRSYAAPMMVTAELLDDLSKLIPLAPLHQPHNLAPIRTIMAAAPEMPQVVCFDTAFHRAQPRLAQALALPRHITDEGVQRYGFHGLSYEYLVSRLRELSPTHADGRLVIAHLGNGASLCAVKKGRSVASTMGFTAVDGLMMGTRCGALDPGVLLYLLQERGMDAATVEDLIYRKSGLLGVSGISSDMRTLRASSDPAAREAIDLFVYRIVREIGSLVAALGGIDSLVFSAGIGEHDPATRAEVVQGCQWLGAAVDPERNAGGNGLISSTASRIAVWVVPTDEELLIARQTAAVLAAGQPG
jgi:acetate kinase